MAAKFLSVLLLATVVSQGYALTQYVLADETLTYYTNQLIGKAISIPKFWWDTLESCHVTLPDGAIFEAYPNNNLPAGDFFFLEAAQPFVSCGIGFRNIGVEGSGTYRLTSLVNHFDESRSVTTQNFHLTVLEIEQ